MERVLILQTLGGTGNNKTRAANCSESTEDAFTTKLKEYGGDRRRGGIGTTGCSCGCAKAHIGDDGPGGCSS